MNKQDAKSKIKEHGSALGKALKALLIKSAIGGPALALLYAASPAQAKEPLHQILQAFEKAPESQQVDISVTEVSTFLSQEKLPLSPKLEKDSPTLE